jgi:hypothetical protein
MLTLFIVLFLLGLRRPQTPIAFCIVLFCMSWDGWMDNMLLGCIDDWMQREGHSYREGSLLYVMLNKHSVLS